MGVFRGAPFGVVVANVKGYFHDLISAPQRPQSLKHCCRSRRRIS